MKLHTRSWDGRFWAYAYIGPLRLTIFNSSWIFGRKKKRTLVGWVWHYWKRGIIPSVIVWTFIHTYYHPHWIIDLLTSIARRIF